MDTAQVLGVGSFIRLLSVCWEKNRIVPSRGISSCVKSNEELTLESETRASLVLIGSQSMTATDERNRFGLEPE